MEPIFLDVGGTIFKTSILTLMGSIYFKGLFECSGLQYPKEAPLFIDRDPEIFRHVLNLLRDRNYKYPREYLSELDFFGIDNPYDVPINEVSKAGIEALNKAVRKGWPGIRDMLIATGVGAKYITMDTIEEKFLYESRHVIAFIEWYSKQPDMDPTVRVKGILQVQLDRWIYQLLYICMEKRDHQQVIHYLLDLISKAQAVQDSL